MLFVAPAPSATANAASSTLKKIDERASAEPAAAMATSAEAANRQEMRQVETEAEAEGEGEREREREQWQAKGELRQSQKCGRQWERAVTGKGWWRERGRERGMSEGSVEFKERAVRGLAALV